MEFWKIARWFFSHCLPDPNGHGESLLNEDESNTESGFLQRVQGWLPTITQEDPTVAGYAVLNDDNEEDKNKLPLSDSLPSVH